MERTRALIRRHGGIFLTASLLIASVPALLPMRVFAQDANVKVLTLQEALSIAAEKNLDILKAKEYRNRV